MDRRGTVYSSHLRCGLGFEAFLEIQSKTERCWNKATLLRTKGEPLWQKVIW
jgi:hypothetical protein